MDGREPARRAERIEHLLGEIAELPDEQVRRRMEELVGMLLDLQGDGLGRIIDLTEQAEGVGGPLLQAFAGDDQVAPLLLLHGLHPVAVEARVARALDDVRPYLRSHGGNVELLGVAGGVARLRLQGSCHGCPSSAMTLKLAIEDAIYKAAPDLDRLEVEGIAEPPPPLITLASARRGSGGARAAERHGDAWTVVPDIQSLAAGMLLPVALRGHALVFCRAADELYAYLNRCGGCAAPLDAGALDGTTLTCPSCGRHYGVAQAGRCLGDPEARLEPVPLLVEAGTVKVALPALAETSQAMTGHTR